MLLVGDVEAIEVFLQKGERYSGIHEGTEAHIPGDAGGALEVGDF